MMSGLCMYLCSSWIGYQYPNLAIHFGNAALPYGFIILLLAHILWELQLLLYRLLSIHTLRLMSCQEHNLYNV